jgi:hypothetical protein
MKAAVLHFKNQNLVNIPEALNLYNTSLVTQAKSLDTHKYIVANVASQDRCTEFKGTDRFDERDMTRKRVITYTRMATWSPTEG